MNFCKFFKFFEHMYALSYSVILSNKSLTNMSSVTSVSLTYLTSTVVYGKLEARMSHAFHRMTNLDPNLTKCVHCYFFFPSIFLFVQIILGVA